MQELTLNKVEDIERLCVVRLTKEQFPIAFENKVQELLESTDLTREEAEQQVPSMEIELELYYEQGYGLFAVECDAVESIDIVSPYSGRKYTEQE